MEENLRPYANWEQNDWAWLSLLITMLKMLAPATPRLSSIVASTLEFCSKKMSIPTLDLT